MVPWITTEAHLCHTEYNSQIKECLQLPYAHRRQLGHFILEIAGDPLRAGCLCQVFYLCERQRQKDREKETIADADISENCMTRAWESTFWQFGRLCVWLTHVCGWCLSRLTHEVCSSVTCGLSGTEVAFLTPILRVQVTMMGVWKGLHGAKLFPLHPLRDCLSSQLKSEL